MPAVDTCIDDYINKSADFAKPILTHLRKVIRETCPEVKEVIKWSFPNFDYKGSILCSMAAFKQHCTFGFWLASLMKDPYHILAAVGEKSSMGHFGPIRSLADLPSDKILSEYIKEAMLLNEPGAKISRKEKPVRTKEIEIPADFIVELEKNDAALRNFGKFSPSNKKEYVEWFAEAKTEATRNKRITTAIEWLQEGISRNWKYQK